MTDSTFALLYKLDILMELFFSRITSFIYILDNLFCWFTFLRVLKAFIFLRFFLIDCSLELELEFLIDFFLLSCLLCVSFSSFFPACAREMMIVLLVTHRCHLLNLIRSVNSLIAQIFSHRFA